MSQPRGSASPPTPSAAERRTAEVAERAEAAAAASAEVAEIGVTQLLRFVEGAKQQVSNTWTTFAIATLAACGLILVLLPAIFVLAVGTARFPNVDYLVTSLTGAVLLIGSVVGLVVDARGKSRDVKELFSAGTEHLGRLDQYVASNLGDGQIDVSTFCHGVLALTDQHLVFTGSRPDGGTRNGRWALTELATVDLVHDRSLGEVLLIGSGSSQMGFHTKKRKAASQELLSRLRTAITRAREVPSKPQASGSVADELAKWAKLRDDGAISEDEFAVAKAELLGH